MGGKSPAQTTGQAGGTQSDDCGNSVSKVRVLCVGNGGVIKREGKYWSHKYVGTFLGDLSANLGPVCFCGWVDPDDDPLSQTSLEDLPDVTVLGLPPLRGGIGAKLSRVTYSFTMLAREILHSQFVYLFWPGRLTSIAARLCRFLGKPYGIYLRGEEVDPDSSFGQAFRRARFVLTTGDAQFAAAKSYCVDVENVVPMTSLRADHIVAPRSLRARGPWRILYVGRIERRKGVQDLISAMAMLEEWGVDVDLTMVGHCYNIDEFFGGMTDSLAAKVKWEGAVPDFDALIPYYLNADAFVFASLDEGFPRVLYEAMALGVPIVTTFVGSIGSIMQDRRNCVRIDVGDPGDVAAKIRALFADTKLMGDIARAGHDDIVTLMKTWKRNHAMQVAERVRGTCQ